MTSLYILVILEEISCEKFNYFLRFPTFSRLLIEKLFCTCKFVTETFQSKSGSRNFIPHIYQVLRKCHRFGVSRNSDSTIHICIVSTNIIRISILAIGDSNHCTTQLPKFSSFEFIRQHLYAILFKFRNFYFN